MKYALVTGASSGIGFQYAQALARRGYNILVVSNRKEDNETVAAQIAADYKVDAVPFYSDLSKSTAAQEIYDFCQEKGYEVEILLSNAGILHFGKLIHADAGKTDAIIAIHCSTPVQLCRLFGADMCKKGKGHILIMSSLTAWTPYPTMSLYGATKVFLKNFGQSIWYEMREYGVSVTTVFPSAVDTPFYKLEDKIRHRLLKLGMMISPQKLADGALNAMFKNKRRYIPGFWTRLEIGLCSIVPTWLFVQIIKLPAIRRILEKL